MGELVHGRTWLVWAAHAGLMGMGAWGTVTAPEVEAAIAVWHPLFERAACGVAVMSDAYDFAPPSQAAYAVAAEYARLHLVPSLRAKAARHFGFLPPARGELTRAVVFGFLAAQGADHQLALSSERADAQAFFQSDEVMARLDEVRAFVTARHGAVQGLLALRNAIRADLVNPDLARLAGTLAMSERSLQRMLGRAGTTLRAEVTTARIEAAQHELQHSDDKIQTIAERVGLKTASYFSRVFRDATGVDPADFRARKR